VTDFMLLLGCMPQRNKLEDRPPVATNVLKSRESSRSTRLGKFDREANSEGCDEMFSRAYVFRQLFGAFFVKLHIGKNDRDEIYTATAEWRR